MYRDLRQHFSWNNMKKEITEFANIMSDRDQRFQAHFFWSTSKNLWNKLNFRSSYHLETDGQTEGGNQILEDMLRACVWEFQGK